MPFCPQCKYEYREGMTVCPDCNVELVDELVAAPESPKLTFSHPPEVVFEGPNEMLAEMVRGALEDNGIRALLQADHSLAGLGIGEFEEQARHSFRVLTLASQAAAARQAIADFSAAYERGDFDIPGSEEAAPEEELPEDLPGADNRRTSF